MAGHRVAAKKVSQEREDSDDAGGRPPGAQGFAAGTVGRQATHSAENEGVGSSDEPQVQGRGQQRGGQAIPNVGARVTTGQPSHTHVFTVGVGELPLPTVRQSLEQGHRGTMTQAPRVTAATATMPTTRWVSNAP